MTPPTGVEFRSRYRYYLVGDGKGAWLAETIRVGIFRRFTTVSEERYAKVYLTREAAESAAAQMGWGVFVYEPGQ